MDRPQQSAQDLTAAMYPPNRSAMDSQELVQQQHHCSPLGQGDSSWQQQYSYSIGQNDGDLYSYKREYDIPSNNPDSPGSFGLHSYNTGSSNTSYSLLSNAGSSYVDPQLLQHSSSPSEYQQQTYLTDAPLVASPDQSTPATLSPALLPYQSGSPTQARHSANRHSGYFDSYLNYQQYPVEQGPQRVASGPQNQEFYPSPGIGSFTPSLLPPDPVRDDNAQDIVADNSGLGPYVCGECGKGCKRLTDLERHLKTTRRHGDPKGPSCPESDCRYTEKFTRTDNFKAHYKRQHGKSDEEADEFIQRWREQTNPGFVVGVSGRGWGGDGRLCLVKAALMKKRRGSGSGGR